MKSRPKQRGPRPRGFPSIHVSPLFCACKGGETAFDSAPMKYNTSPATPSPAALAASVDAMSPAAIGDLLAGLVIANVTGKAPALPQIVAGRSVRIMRKKNGEGKHGARVAVIDGDRAGAVPVELLSLCAGRSLWMREISVKCLDCRKETRAGDLENEYCPACFDKALSEVGD